MFKALRDFLEQLPHLADPDPQAVERALQRAAAVMLAEVMRADATVRPVERDAVHRALREQFALSADEAVDLAEQAARTAAQSTDLFEFTSLVDAHLDMGQKIRIVEHMCRVAYADGTLSDHERHILWRIADLLHVPQAAYVHARTRARQAAQETQPKRAPAGR
jgi:uncharacterized tellurite resistance protein B-like protein